MKIIPGKEFVYGGKTYKDEVPDRLAEFVPDDIKVKPKPKASRTPSEKND